MAHRSTIGFPDRIPYGTIEEIAILFPMPSPHSSDSTSRLSPEQLARLKAEATSPYRGLRKFLYLCFGASGLIGGFIFLLGLLAGRQDLGTGLPNLGIQVGVVAFMAWLWQIDRDRRA